MKFRKSLMFTLALLPAALVGGIFMTLYQMDALDAALLSEAQAQLGGVTGLIAVSAVQAILYTAICGFFGHLLASKLGLIRNFRLERRAVCMTLFISIAGGILFSLDPWVFGRLIPEVSAIAVQLSFSRFISSVLYGGIIEEVMLRLFVMSLIAFIIWKLFLRRHDKAPACALIISNVISALLFAAGHLPATLMLFGRLDAIILARCFLLNGGFGLIFGYLYRKHGIQYAMLSHALLHVISQAIWYIFI